MILNIYSRAIGKRNLISQEERVSQLDRRRCKVCKRCSAQFKVMTRCRNWLCGWPLRRSNSVVVEEQYVFPSVSLWEFRILLGRKWRDWWKAPLYNWLYHQHSNSAFSCCRPQVSLVPEVMQSRAGIINPSASNR